MLWVPFLWRLLDPEVARLADGEVGAATERIVRTLVANPTKDTVYFSVDEPDSNKIGLRIFRGAVGDDVIDYISAKLTTLAASVRAERLK